MLNNNSINRTNDYKDTFCTYRILFYLKNNNDITKRKLYAAFEALGYDREAHIDQSINILLEKCLISPDFGTKLGDLNNDTPINISIAGKYYCEEIIKSLTYHDYILSDVFMEEEYIYPISKTYSKGKVGYDLDGRREQRKLYILFLKQEERDEEKDILEKGWSSYDEFLKEFGHIHEGKPEKITDMILSRGNVDI